MPTPKKTGEDDPGAKTKDLPKTAGEGVPPDGKNEHSPFPTWLIASIMAGLVLLVLVVLASMRRLTPRTNLSPAKVKQTCKNCGAVVNVFSTTAGTKYQCPGCGTVQTVRG